MKKFLFISIVLLLFSFSVFGQSDTTSDNDFLFRKDKPGYQYRIGLGNSIAAIYYRRAFGIGYDIFADIRLVRGLFLEAGLKALLYQYSVTHFYPIVVQNFENAVNGSYCAVRTALKYRFDILEHFGLLLGTGFMIGLGAYSCMDTWNFGGRNREMVSCAGLELSPEFTIGATIPFKRYRFDITCFKWLPIIVAHYNYNDHTWRGYKIDADSPGLSYQVANGSYSPMRPICWSAMGVAISFTYFFK